MGVLAATERAPAVKDGVEEVAGAMVFLTLDTLVSFLRLKFERSSISAFPK